MAGSQKSVLCPLVIQTSSHSFHWHMTGDIYDLSFLKVTDS